MGSPAEYTIIVLVVLVGVGVWTLLDRVGQLQRELDALKRRDGLPDSGTGLGEREHDPTNDQR